MSAPTHPLRAEGESRVPYWLAVATFVAAMPLVLFGGTVTSLDAGMAIDGWLVLEPGRGDHFLLAYPIDKWFRDAGTFVEHTHRLFGVLVGLLAIATLASTLVLRLSAARRLCAAAALLAICAQGALGGFRVLENSPRLAFLHGAFAQAVIALLAVQASLLAREWASTRPSPCKLARGLHRLSAAAVGGVYVASFAGAWLRHGQGFGPLALHLFVVLGAVGLLLALCAKLRATVAAGEAGGGERRALGVQRRRILGLLAVQVLLGLGSFWIVFLAVGPSAQRVHDSIFPTLHVFFGALLLAQTASTAAWSRRVVTARPEPSAGVARPRLEGAA